ncbi:hypothetical protein [Rhodoferax sp.]|jgi:hypothetical protein|uniref:hypothetical protein n=1 Tax=Rhodoferax sp. TaxID=50421 RepID=UPI003783613B
MHRSPEIFSLRRQIDAQSVEALQHAVQSVLADAWHSPAGVLSASQPGQVRTRIGIALDPRLLRRLHASDAAHFTHDLCRWMRSLHVEYTVGYSPHSTSLPFGRVEHRLTVELFRSSL